MINIMLPLFFILLFAENSAAMYRKITKDAATAEDRQAKVEDYLKNLVRTDIGSLHVAMHKLEAELKNWISEQHINSPEESLAFLYTMQPFLAILNISIAFAAHNAGRKFLEGFPKMRMVFITSMMTIIHANA